MNRSSDQYASPMNNTPNFHYFDNDDHCDECDRLIPIKIIIINIIKDFLSPTFWICGNLGKTGLIDGQKLPECNLYNFLIAMLPANTIPQIKKYIKRQSIHYQDEVKVCVKYKHKRKYSNWHRCFNQFHVY